MKQIIYVTILILCLSSVTAQSCLPEGITFTTQSQIDSFQINYPGCNEIEGDLTINGGNEIINLNGLAPLKSIVGSLDISDNYSLTNLSGLDSLVTIGADLILHTNTSLYSLTGLEKLDSIGNWLVLYMNPGLSSLSGLKSLSEIGGQLWIEYCHSLPNLNGLDNLETIGGRLVIRHNPGLHSLTGLQNLNTVGEYIEIWYNHELGSLEGLRGLNSINGDLMVVDNDMLVSLSGLNNIESSTIGSLRIYANPSLSTCEVESVCAYLASPNGVIEIHDNATGCNSPDEVLDSCEANAVNIDEQFIKDNLIIYPNPANQELKVLTEGFIIDEVVIYTLTGQQVIQERPKSNTINISTLQPGMYIVEVTVDNQKARKKLLVLW